VARKRRAVLAGGGRVSRRRCAGASAPPAHSSLLPSVPRAAGPRGGHWADDGPPHGASPCQSGTETSWRSHRRVPGRSTTSSRCRGPLARPRPVWLRFSTARHGGSVPASKPERKRFRSCLHSSSATPTSSPRYSSMPEPMNQDERPVLTVLPGGRPGARMAARLTVLPRRRPFELAAQLALNAYIACFFAWNDHLEVCSECRQWEASVVRDPCDRGGELWSAEVLAEYEADRMADRARDARRRVSRRAEQEC